MRNKILIDNHTSILKEINFCVRYSFLNNILELQTIYNSYKLILNVSIK